VIPEKFQHILRVMNTNIDGRRKVAFALTAIKVRCGYFVFTATFIRGYQKYFVSLSATGQFIFFYITR